jgi:hypothetical protein
MGGAAAMGGAGGAVAVGGAGGAGQCPTEIPSRGDPCSVVGSCLYTGCPEGQVTGGGEKWVCMNGAFAFDYADYNCMPGSSSGASGSSTGTSM